MLFRRKFSPLLVVGTVVFALWYLQRLPGIVVQSPNATLQTQNPLQQLVETPAEEAQSSNAPTLDAIELPEATRKPIELVLQHGQDADELSVHIPVSSPTHDQAQDQPTGQPVVKPFVPLPTETSIPILIPKLQHDFGAEAPDARAIRLERLTAVKSNFEHAWDGYKKHAWMKDELSPVEAGSVTTFGGWAATLVDSLDTLWILGLEDEFRAAVAEAGKIDFTTSEADEINLFETTIRYLGGLLGAYDISHGKFPVLLDKAKELGNVLYRAFDTPNRMPITRWHFKAGSPEAESEASEGTLLAEIGSLSLEFTRLSQLTGDSKYFDAIQRITDALAASQNSTLLPGLWPVVVDAKALSFNVSGFTLGGMADSTYEYLPKQHLLLGGSTAQYKELYANALAAAKQHLFFRPMVIDDADILFSGSADVDVSSKTTTLDPKAQHLACFTGGMVAIGAKILDQADDMAIARKLVNGCIWAYNSTVTGIMPELFSIVACDQPDQCEWDEQKWHHAVLTHQNSEVGANATGTNDERARRLIHDQRLPPGYFDIDNRQYILRPEAIESIFVLYRLTGDSALPEAAWKMWRAIEKHTRTAIAHAAITDVTVEDPQKDNRMESFWLAETLKYFYLMFSEPDVLSLDEFVL